MTPLHVIKPFLCSTLPAALMAHVVQLPSHVQLFATPRTAAHSASLCLIISRSLLKFTSIESVMPSNHLILCHPLLLLPSIFPSLRVFSNESALCIRWPKYWSFSFNISPSNVYSGPYRSTYPTTLPHFHSHQLYRSVCCIPDTTRKCSRRRVSALVFVYLVHCSFPAPGIISLHIIEAHY